MKTLTAVLIGSSIALSFSAEATPCADLWAANPQSKSESFIQVSQTQPDITNEVRDESIKLCETAAMSAKNGLPLNYIIRQVNKSSRGLPDDGRVSMMFMAVGGWNIGKN